MSDPVLEKLLTECTEDASAHHFAQRFFAHLNAVAQNSTSTAEAGRLIYEHMTAGDDVTEWTQLHMSMTKIILSQWHQAAIQAKNERDRK